MNPITKFILSRLSSEIKEVDSFTGIVYKDCWKCETCVHIFKTMQEDPCWDCIEHNFDAYKKV